MTSIERLTAQDQIMLWPDEIWPQDIGALAILDGRDLFDIDGSFRIAAVREAVGSRLDLVPRSRQLLCVPPRRLGGPLWIDAPAFDLNDHVAVHPLPTPADEGQLLAAIEQLRRRPLDRSRPLWEMWFLPGLSHQRVGLFMRTHHSIADGIAGVATFATFLDATPDAVQASPKPRAPAAPPTSRELFVDSLLRQAKVLGRGLSKLFHPVSTLRGVLAGWPALREIIADEELPATSLGQVVGPDRKFAFIRTSLDSVKEVAHTYDAKVNDVLLTVIAGGLRDLLRSRGEPVDDVLVRVYVPVTLRHGQFDHARGNQIAQMVIPLPIGVSDPVHRLHHVAAETAERKARNRPALGKMPHRGFLGRQFLKLIDRQQVNVTTADLPGPPFPLYFSGAEVLEVFPILPLIGKVALGVGAMSYAGQFNITVVADGGAHPDLDVLVAGISSELESLTRLVGVEAKQTSR